VQLKVHAVTHRHSRSMQAEAEPGKLATPRTTSHGVTRANRMDTTRPHYQFHVRSVLLSALKHTHISLTFNTHSKNQQ